MTSLLILVPVSLALLGVATGFFVWAVRCNQFDDLGRAGRSILFDDDLQVHADSDDRPADPGR